MDHRSLEIENRQLKVRLEQLSHKSERHQILLQKLFDIELNLLACNTLSTLLDLMLVRFKALFELDQVHLILLDPEYTVRNLLGRQLQALSPSLQFVDNQNLLRELYPQEEISIIHSTTRQALLFPDVDTDINSCAMLPLIRSECLIGSLHMGSRSRRYFAVDDPMLQQYLQHLASVISICFENCVSQENLVRLSCIDVLTKVHNRRSFELEIIRELSRSSRTGQRLGCLFLDLDHFKKINDNFGHQTGDMVLREVGTLLKQQVRTTDIIARYGGEEFAILLPGCSEAQAVKLARQLCKNIGKLELHSENNHPVQVTTSIGVAACQPAGAKGISLDEQAQQLINAADKALYKAKRDGRNRVTLAPTMSYES